MFSATSPDQAAAMLVACRLGGLCLSAPVFSSRILPARLRIGIVAVIALSAVLSAQERPGATADSEALLHRLERPLEGWLLIASELFLGFALGWASLLVLGAVAGACQLMSQLMGISLGAATDNASGPEVQAIARLYHMLSLFVFLSVDLHHTMIRTVLFSFSWVPLGTLDSGNLLGLLVRLAAHVGPDIFAAALTLALPIVLVMLLVSLAQGILGKMVPSTELLVLGLPVRTFLGLTVLVFVLPASAEAVRGLLETAVFRGEALLQGLR